MSHKVTIKTNINHSYSLDDKNANLTINGNLNCETEKISIIVNKFILNGVIRCKKISVFARSIIINGQIYSISEIRLHSEDLSCINASIASFKRIYLLGNKIITKAIIYSKISISITAKKLAIIKTICSEKSLSINITDYIIKIGKIQYTDLYIYHDNSEKKLITTENIEKALCGDFNISDIEIRELLKLSNKF